jgi:hypothetical protein
MTCQPELEPCRETEPLDGGQSRERQRLKVGNQSQMAGETLARFG